MIINTLERSIQLKICYYGPAMSGKTTSIRSLFDHFGRKDKVHSIETSHNLKNRRTLFFDYGTISFKNQYFLLKLHIYSTTGQDFYIITRPATLQGIDGIIFVADSQTKALDRNILSWKELESYFQERLIQIPKIIAFNKQDLPKKFNPNRFLEDIQYKKYDNIDTEYTIALNGENILASFENILRLIFQNYYKSEMMPSIS